MLPHRTLRLKYSSDQKCEENGHNQEMVDEAKSVLNYLLEGVTILKRNKEDKKINGLQ